MSQMAPSILLTILLSLTISTTQPYNKHNPNQTKNKLMLLFFISLMPMSTLLNKNHETTLTAPPMIKLATENITPSLTFDTLSLAFTPVALFITWSIISFSTWYMSNDPNINKFIKYLSLFLITMIIIITSNNMYQLIIGWEGVGIMSFLLINWWGARSNANTAALQALVYNRIGDIGLIMALAWLMSSSSMNIQELLTQHDTMNTLPLLGLVAAAMGKSAQIGLHPWLPTAMEGPTPVSALLHSSTMVVAGVFLLIRLNPILATNKTMTTTCLILGATTTMFAATSAITHKDIKKIIALSTTSQLGLMMTMVGLNQPTLAFLHMITHSFFKALLFLCSGTFIHNTNNDQDVRMMGSLLKTMPMTSSFITIASLSLTGTPYLSGFYSKDIIIETMMNTHVNSWALTATLMATALSATYSTQIIYFALTNYPRTNQNTHQETEKILSPLARLAIMSTIIGLLTKISTLQTSALVTTPKAIKLMALMITITSMTISLDILYITTLTPSQKPKTTTSFFNQLAFFGTLHRKITMTTMKLSQQISTELTDLWALENWGPKGLSNTSSFTIQLSTQQTNLVKNYMTTFTLTMTIFMVIIML
uniref:NADH-ubiquinone oxidoreductase chain 5 n=1 Tax=Pareas formosensis TaxID=1008428 RepID=A0A8A0XX03_9SAUR|nr:NADH dehydrogenase subunit 5 [Pareas formosensis]QSQ87113.1 NADH dehydrogenase subunit 5 [Pareas formosensis]